MADPAQAHSTLIVIGIVLGALVSEDAATIGAASLAAAHVLTPLTAIAAAAFGIWAGDLGLYGLATSLGPALANKRWIAERLTPQKLARAKVLAHKWGVTALAISRFIPGTRLPSTVLSGFLKIPFGRFATVTGLCSFLWVTAVFSAVVTLNVHAESPFVPPAIVALALCALGLLVSRWGKIIELCQRWKRWEFWPAWLFYAPVAGMCAWLAIKYRGLALPALANLNQKHGGIIGESKYEILREIRQVAPQQVAEARLLPPGPTQVRLRMARSAADDLTLQFPFVLKPNVGQRGAGFRVIQSWAEVSEYLDIVSAPVLLQRYVPGPNEAGIFYYRFPGQVRGEIFAITEKVFPYVTGDGSSTLEELIEMDPRAHLISRVYKKRFANTSQQVVPAGMQIRLVEAGNHCQGCIFRDGAHLNSPELTAKIDAISSAISGFFIGRYDVRYETAARLRAGEFTIVELNGAAAEATNIYDERFSLREAYRALYRQWDLVYRIGAMNRARGAMRVSLSTVLKEWLSYCRIAATYPGAD